MRISRRHLLAGSAAAAAAPAQTGSAPQPATGRVFTGEALREIAFPLGGIGTGTVSLGGYGNLRDWEIFNRPNKGGVLPFTFAALRLSGGGLAKPRIRVLERIPLPPFTGGSGVPRETAIGLPHFQEATFTGAYPFAHVRFRDARLPVEVSLEAFNPMIPLETGDSSLPVAILAYRVTSRARSRLDAALAFSLMNPAGYDGVSRLHSRRASFFGQNFNEFRSADGQRGLFLSSRKYAADSTRYGSLALLTSVADTSYRLEWDHGPWWDDFQEWWDEFLSKGRFPGNASQPSAEGETEYATLASHFSLAPGESRQVVHVLAWHFPNTENYWTSEPEHKGEPLPNHYGSRWPSAWEPAAYTLSHYESLRARSLRYRDTLFSSTLPAPVLDAVSSQASILRTNTVMVLAGPKTLAFEGCNDNGGCCPMNCTHVFNYEQAMAHLYPDVERGMREIDFLVNMRPDGSMSFRTPVPLRQGGNHIHPAADGQMGCVLKVYREWQLGAGDEWLRKLWPKVRRALEYAWAKWDADRDGVMEGEQHNTYDIEFYGPNSMMGSLYLGALLAASKMAAHLGDQAAARAYQDLFRQGAARLDRLLWNGEYYVQKVDESQPKAAKYQYGEGCLSDQLLGQWFAEVVNLGKLLPHDHVQKALDSIYRYNFRQEFETLPNAQRIYALEDEKGLLLCSWPQGKRPALPFVYSDEVWTGIEYQVAAHLIYEGRVKEGLAIVDAVRSRYDGRRRNPWNEVECGHHYARAMSSWSVLTALSGFSWSAPRRELGFRPRTSPDRFRCLFSTGTSWGAYSQERTAGKLAARIQVEGGRLEMAALRLPFENAAAQLTSAVPATLAVSAGEAVIRFASPVALRQGEKLELSLG
ncbi:MAG TPA: GH116 family glycosyl hydrolase [Bryobacteraceae bacterium]|nr:GH116 family glycosyl hydrolase [Bryobacteraceae bacterium]